LITKWLFIALAVYGLERFCHSQTEGFALRRITASAPFTVTWPHSAPPSAEAERALAQPFHYFSKGAQAYVFLSADGEYVLKCFRLDHLAPPPWTRWLRGPCFEQKRLARIHRRLLDLRKDCTSYALAFDKMREETALLYVHLEGTPLIPLTLYDRLSIAHLVDPSTLYFVLQRKAELVYPTLAKLSTDELRAPLWDLIHLLHTRESNAIFDKDPDLHTNFGFLAGRAVQIDPGRYAQRSAPLSPEERCALLLNTTEGLRGVVAKRSPSLALEMIQEIERVCAVSSL
jgi:hypothetical protein